MVMRLANAGLKVTTLPQVSVVMGFGNSCSQPTFANCPSQIVESGRKTMSRPSLVLVVEDEEKVRHVTVDALRELGYT